MEVDYVVTISFIVLWRHIYYLGTQLYTTDKGSCKFQKIAAHVLP